MTTPGAPAAERFGKWAQLPAWIVGADRIRPSYKAPLWGALYRIDTLVNPYSPCEEAASIHHTALSHQLAGGFYPPLQGVCKTVSEWYRIGRVRELTYRYTPRSVIVRRHCRSQPIFRITPTMADRRINQMG